MTSSPFYRLNVDFVDAVRVAYLRDWPTIQNTRDLRRMPWHGFGEIWAGTERCCVVARQNSRDSRRLQQLADAIGYTGPILGEVMP